MSDAVTEESPAPTASELLVAAREQRELSQKDVADQLFLTATFIRYIDDGLFHKIPKQAFIKGYLRSYSRVVGLDGDEVVARYQEELESDHRVDIRDVTEERVGSAALTGPVLQTGLIGLGGIVVVVALVWAFSGDDEEVLPIEEVSEARTISDDAPEMEIVSLPSIPAVVEHETDENEAVEDEAVEDEAVENEAVGTEIVGIQAVESEPEEVVEEPIRQAMLLDDESIQEAIKAEEVNAEALRRGVSDAEESDAFSDSIKEITVERTSDDAYEYITVDSGGFDQLEFTFTGECWVEVEDADGDSIYGDLNRDSDILTVYGTAPFKILLGRASAVTLRHNGTEIDLALHTTSDQTAKLNVGG